MRPAQRARGGPPRGGAGRDRRGLEPGSAAVVGAVKGREGRGLTAAMVEQTRRFLGGLLRALSGSLRSKLCRTNKTLRRPVLHEPATRDPGTGVDDEPQARVVILSCPCRVAGKRITLSLTPMRFDAQPFKVPPEIADRQCHATRLRIGLEGKGSDLSAL